jgi:hypothetical protein
MLRSDKANRYYHKCVKNEIAKEIGLTPQETHERLLIMFALIDVTETEYIVESTTTMDRERFWMFVEQCKAWAISQLNINIEGWYSFEDYKPKTIKK